MQYFFKPGRLLDLSYAELDSVLKAQISGDYSLKLVEDRFFLVTAKTTNEEMVSIFHRLGGFVSFGEMISDLDAFLEGYAARKNIEFGISRNVSKKTEWGDREVSQLANKIKKSFTSQKISTRFILPDGYALNAAQVTKNELINKGFELIIMQKSAKEHIYGRTLAVQDIDAFAEREYERPGTDREMGVLPLKLARIMTNLAGQDKGIIWDPFCGSGTILLEALLLGNDVIGSDIDPMAINNSQRNIDWLYEKEDLGEGRYNLFEYDIKKMDKRVSRKLTDTEVSAVVTEPYMGPPQRRPMGVAKAKELLENVSVLYRAMFETVQRISSKGFKVVIVVPSYKTHKGWATMSVNQLIGNRWKIDNRKWGKDLHWMRPNSIIKRNIFILSRK